MKNLALIGHQEFFFPHQSRPCRQFWQNGFLFWEFLFSGFFAFQIPWFPGVAFRFSMPWSAPSMWVRSPAMNSCCQLTKLWLIGERPAWWFESMVMMLVAAQAPGSLRHLSSVGALGEVSGWDLRVRQAAALAPAPAASGNLETGDRPTARPSAQRPPDRRPPDRPTARPI